MDKNTAIVFVTAIISVAVVSTALIISFAPSQQTPALKTCSQQSGSICTSDQSCPGQWLASSDSNKCCSSACLLNPPLVSDRLDSPGSGDLGGLGGFGSLGDLSGLGDIGDLGGLGGGLGGLGGGLGGLGGAPPSNVQPTEHPLLWKVESQSGRPSYLFGTIHIPDDRVLALSNTVGKALEASDVFCAETPLDTTSVLNIASESMLPSGTTLQTVLPPSLYRRSENYVRSHGYSMSLFNSFKIWAFAGSLEMLDYMDDMVTKKPLDIYIYNAASSLGKGLCGVETLEEQVDLFDSFTTNEQLKMLNMTLTQLEDSEARGVDAIQALVDAYLAGDEQALSDKSTEGLDLSDPFIQKYLDTIMISRNHRMASRMASKIRAEPGKSFFFAVGSAHYPGDEGILALLRADGYIVSRMVPTTAEDKARWSPAGIPSGASSGGDWCPSGLTQNYNIAQAGGDVAVEFVGLEMRNGKQMCHIVITYGAYDTSIDAWIDEQGGYDIGGLGGMGLGGSGGLGGSSGLDLFG